MHTLAGRGALDRDEMAMRLILLIYAYGTNTGVRAVAAGDHGHAEEDLRYVRRRYQSAKAARPVAAAIANATFAARQSWLWARGRRRSRPTPALRTRHWLSYSSWRRY